MKIFCKVFGEFEVRIKFISDLSVEEITIVSDAGSLYRQGRVEFKLGYIMNTPSWLVSSCIPREFRDSVDVVNALKEAMDIFVDGEFTHKELIALGYTKKDY
jgi:hypothetical protein